MRILFLSNNPVSESLVTWLAGHDEDVIERKEAISLSGIRGERPDFIISYNYRFLIQEDIIRHFGPRIVNLHSSFLPWNRGAYPNVWSFLENTPKGVSIHCIDKGIDTGPLVLQKRVCFDESAETLFSSYEKLHRHLQGLFMENWEDIKNIRLQPKAQPAGGSFHGKRDFESIMHILGTEGWNVRIPDLRSRFDGLRVR